nr:FAD-binding protein [Legionella jordanis]
MLGANKTLSNFSNAVKTSAHCLRPDNEEQLGQVFNQTDALLARGNGSSYGDCCVNHEGIIVDTTRLNHLLSFDRASGLLTAQASVTFADLFSVDPSYIPPVIPGTLRATLAGGIANDVHGKNNHQSGSFGHHIAWLDLQLDKQSYHCSPKENRQLFYATIGGLGLTGIIKRIGLKMRKASHFVVAGVEKYAELKPLLERMQSQGIQYDYQVAWLDLLNQPQRAVLSFANHSELVQPKLRRTFSIPKLPFRLLSSWNMRWFNRYYFSSCQSQEVILPLPYFNNPLDAISHWNRLYGRKGLIQFQAVFKEDEAYEVIQRLLQMINNANANPMLAVLKYFTKPGDGLLSFPQPGFTLAIDFINNRQAQTAIKAMNAFISDIKGKIYLAKDLLLTPGQFQEQYSNHQEFIDLLHHYQSPMSSDLSRRLEITS